MFFYSTVVLWLFHNIVVWSCGNVLIYAGVLYQCPTIVLWFCDNVVQWSCGIDLLWYYCTVGFSYYSSVLLWHCPTIVM